MPSASKSVKSVSLDQAAFALLLLVGLYFPSSVNGEHSTSAILAAFAFLAVLLFYLAWRLGVRRNIALFVSLPMVAILLACTFYRFLQVPADFDAGLFLKFGILALVFSLNLRAFRAGSPVRFAFVLANLANIACGIAVLMGAEWVAEFLPTHYWTSDADLVPLMITLHKPILTFGSHALAGLFSYLFFWANWEDFRLGSSKLALGFAFCYLGLLLGLASFTSLGFAALAAAQVSVWAWKRGRRVFAAFSTCVWAIVLTVVCIFADAVDSDQDLPQLAELALLNSDRNGPISRYGPDGTLRPAMTYLSVHPFSPIGLARSANALDVASPTQFFVGDSGPLEYLLRGSVPLLFLIYFGLYRFLRNNLLRYSHWITLFVVIIIFETGFSALDSSRTLFLLPFFVVYLNHTASSSASQSRVAPAAAECHTFSG